MSAMGQKQPSSIVSSHGSFVPARDIETHRYFQLSTSIGNLSPNDFRLPHTFSHPVIEGLAKCISNPAQHRARRVISERQLTKRAGRFSGGLLHWRSHCRPKLACKSANCDRPMASSLSLAILILADCVAGPFT